MKIYIMTDMEGVSGISRVEQTMQDSPFYAAGQRLLIGDVNAAIAGAFDGGATEVTVCDGHSSGFNLLLEEMDLRAVYECPNGARDYLPGLDASFEGVFCIGAHAMAGTLNAFLDHTQSTATVMNYWMNGRKCGELAQVAAIAGRLEVPLLLVSGDQAACDEARDFFGDIELVSVKQALGRQKARCLHPQKAREMIRQSATDALKLIGKIKPFQLRTPLTTRIEYTNTRFADIDVQRSGNIRLDGRTIERVVDNVRDFWSF